MIAAAPAHLGPSGADEGKGGEERGGEGKEREGKRGKGRRGEGRKGEGRGGEGARRGDGGEEERIERRDMQKLKHRGSL